MKRTLLLAVMGILVAAGMFRLRFDTDVLNLLPEELREVRGLKAYQRYFAQDDEVVISVVSESREVSATAARSLAEGLEARTEFVASAAWQQPWMDDAAGTAEFIAWLWLSQAPEKVEELRARFSEGESVRRLEEAVNRLGTSLSPLELAQLGHDPLGISEVGGLGASGAERPDLFSSRDGKLRLIFVRPARKLEGLGDWSEWIGAVRDETRRMADGADWTDEVRIGMTGTPVFTVETAGSMERDMKQSVLCTVVLIACLFWWAHRRFWPLGWMLLFLGSALACTMAIGGFIYGSLNVVSLGFAAILLGLGVDYALVSYQELLGHPRASAGEIRKLAGPGIWWSAGTTALAFALLNFAGLPGLGQLGTLVAIGIITAAAAMLHGFVPTMTWKPPAERPRASGMGWNVDRHAWGVSLGLLIASVLALAFFWPGVDRTSDALGTADGEAGRVAREIDEKMSGGAETLWLVVEGRTIDEVGERFQKLGEELKAGSPGLNYELPFEVWPNAGHQERNLRTVAGLDAELPRLERAAEAAGFEPEALDLTRAVVGAWGRFHGQAVPVWPQTGAGKWLVDRIAARTENGWAGLGVLRLGRDEPVPAIETPGVLVAGWSRIAESLLGQVETRLRWLTGVMALALAACLRLALGSWRGVILSFGTLGFGLLLTSAMMALFGWQWNLMSLTAIPLLLGAAVDYAIHVQLALRRTQGDALEMRRTIGRALGLVTAGAVAGFGSLAFSSNAGLRSFELVCALGMICIFLVAVYLLPGWAAGRGAKG